MSGIQAFSGINTANPVDVENGQASPSSTSHAAPSVTTTLANAMLVASHALCLLAHLDGAFGHDGVFR